MLATQVKQKDGVFYFAAYPAEDLLDKVRFISRFYSEGDSLEADSLDSHDEVGQFISRIEKSDEAFQREISTKKVAAIENFYETALSQPPIPSTVLLFTSESLRFDPVGRFDNVGNLEEPTGKYLIIDGQHRLAALHFYSKHHPEEAKTIHVPCVIFDGKSEDFATEMFVLINSTPTRINKSHLIDLYEKVQRTEPDRKFAAKVVDKLYAENDSPLQYKINRLGGRSKQEKWILQAELFNEIHRWVKTDWENLGRWVTTSAAADRFYEQVRDFFKAAEHAFGDIWGHQNFMVTNPVTIKAMLRVCADLVRQEGPAPTENRVQRWQEYLAPWTNLKKDFRREGFYERFPAKGQLERVVRIYRELTRHIEAEQQRLEKLKRSNKSEVA